MCCKKKTGEKLPRNPDRNNLRRDVAAEYELVGIAVGTYTVKGFGTIHLADICLCIAKELVQSGFKYLQKKPDIYAKKTPPTKSKTSVTKLTEKVELDGGYPINEPTPAESISDETNSKSE